MPLDSTTKVCTRCGRMRPRSMFHRHPVRKDGLHPRCKDCRNAAGREYRRRPGIQARERTRRRAPGFKAAQRAYMREYRQRSDAKRARRAAVRKYHGTPNGQETIRRYVAARRARKSHALSDGTRLALAEVAKRQGNRCVRCGKLFTARIKPTDDHVKALSNGGDNTARNQVALCQPCNSGKQAHDNLIVQLGMV